MAKGVDFWEEYAVCARKAGVPDANIRWYAKWVERFAKCFRSIPLRERSVEDVKAFLNDLRADEQVQEWQIEQARQALRILYRDHYGFKGSTMRKSRDGVARDVVTQPQQLEALHGPLLKKVHDVIRMRHYSPRTESSYLNWIKRFISFHDLNSPDEMNESHVREFLSYLAVEKKVSASTQNQALNAIVFLFTHGLERDAGDFSDFIRAKVPKRRPDTLSREQVMAIIDELSMPHKLMVMLMYGAGLRIAECLSLRIRAIHCSERTIHVHGKGAKDRIVPLPPDALDLLRDQLSRAKIMFEEDSLYEPTLEWGEFYVFPSTELHVENRDRCVSRRYISRVGVAKALRHTAKSIGITAHVTPHCFRHSFASHMVEDGVHIQTIQELLGHARLSTTFLYAHPMNRPGPSPISPLTRVRAQMKDSDTPISDSAKE